MLQPPQQPSFRRVDIHVAKPRTRRLKWITRKVQRIRNHDVIPNGLHIERDKVAGEVVIRERPVLVAEEAMIVERIVIVGLQGYRRERVVEDIDSPLQEV